MNVEKLYSMQAGLDTHIEVKHGLKEEDLFDRKMLALLVELGELANETRSFKFWSLKPASDKEVILEEFVDGVHFILSLGLESGFRYKGDQYEKTHESSVTEQFLKIYGTIHEFRTNKTSQVYTKLFRDYLDLADMLGFTENEIEQAYIEKNEVNYERQQKGY
ncbi:dUTP diphosphatase [Mesobacillus maritimus]|uniref:dUTP diphosphatase n=1 Tax=Mesobacillus maritimus TaxID=1643336 RepID=A0ABS7KAD5_9BACI|nr:dUTP diphosphatase [Mesobacillus maritimus]MBY0099050.1 dUTP diphosphatase [Mesobacillus maritimus]